MEDMLNLQEKITNTFCDSTCTMNLENIMMGKYIL